MSFGYVYAKSMSKLKFVIECSNQLAPLFKEYKYFPVCMKNLNLCSLQRISHENNTYNHRFVTLCMTLWQKLRTANNAQPPMKPSALTLTGIIYNFTNIYSLYD